jgi:ketosteroid isomerase-like protein
MSQSHFAILRRVIEAFNAADTETVLSLLHPDVEFRSALVERKTYRGPSGVQQYAADLASVWEDWHTEEDRLVGAGETVVHLCRIIGRGKGSGVPVAQDIAWVWIFRDDKPWQGTVYLDQSEALEGVGLSE